MKYFTEQKARLLAEFEKDYFARKANFPGNAHAWVVWSNASDHHVEFDQRTIDQLTESLGE